MTTEPLFISFEIAFFATLLAAFVGIAVAGLVSTRAFPGRDLLEAAFSAPLVLPPTVLGYYLLVALGRSSMIGRFYERLTGSSIVFTKTGAVIAAAVSALPIVVTTSRAALSSVDPSLIAAARTLGAGELRAFWTVRLPLASRGVLAACMLAFARALGEFGVTLMVAGDIPGETQTAALAIYDSIQAHRDDDALGLVLVLTALGLGSLYLFTKLVRRSVDERP